VLKQRAVQAYGGRGGKTPRILISKEVVRQMVVVECVIFLLRIREVPDSNLNPQTGYHDCGFSWFSQALCERLWYNSPL
jgi:hypothetical protein